ncbi:MAG: DUF6691 family protein [Siculibacillus sp.]
MRPLFSLFVGLVFGLGLVLSGMTRPGKVIGFLDFTGAWDPSLAFVMAGAIGIGFFLFRVAARRLAPPSHRVDPGLITGSVLFGVGWGLVGYCPGPALAAIASGEPKAFAFVAAMIAGTALQRFVTSLRDPTVALDIGEPSAREAPACG